MMKLHKPKKMRVWIYVDEEIVDWVNSKVKDKTFADITHCFEKLVYKEMKKK